MIGDIRGLINALGGPTVLSKKLGCRPQNISLWPLRQEIPTGWHYRLHLMMEARELRYDRAKLFGIPRGFGQI